MSWRPEEAKVKMVVRLIELYKSGENEKLQQAFAMHNDLKKKPDFAAYAGFVFVQEEIPQPIRERAGLMMKETLRLGYEDTPGNIQDVCRRMLLKAIVHPSPYMRRTAAATISAIVRNFHLKEWPNLVQNLLAMLKEHTRDETPAACEGILTALENVASDAAGDLEQEDFVANLMDALVSFARKEHEPTRQLALKTFLHFFHWQARPLLEGINTYAAVLLEVMKSSRSTETRSVVCESLILLMNEHWAALRNSGIAIMDFMLAASKDPDRVLAEHALEFWLYYACDTRDESKDQTLLLRFLSDVIPVLMKRLRYTDQLLEGIDLEHDNCEEHPDREEDMVPLHYQTRRHHLAGEERLERDQDDDETKWNVRKAAGRQIDRLAGVDHLRQKFITMTLPYVESYLKASDPLNREAGMMALGALASKSYDFATNQLKGLIPFVRQQMDDEHILVASMACWCSSRFCKWYASDEGKAALPEVLKGLLRCMTRPSKRTQRAACGALATMASHLSKELLPFSKKIVAVLVQCLQKYRLINFHNLLDLMGTLLDNWACLEEGADIVRNTELMDMTLQPLMRRWTALGETDSTSVFPVMECLTRVCAYMGPTEHFQKQFVPGMARLALQMSIRLNQQCREWREQMREAREKFGPMEEEELEAQIELDKPNVEYWISALDMLAGLCETSNPALGKAVFHPEMESKAMVMLYSALEDLHEEVRRNALALLGDLIHNYPARVEPHFQTLVRPMVTSIQAHWGLVAQNASWCTGCALLKFPEKMAAVKDEVFKHLVAVLMAPAPQGANVVLVTNVSITLARLAFRYPDYVAQHWQVCAREWMIGLGRYRQDEEKVKAFQALLQVIRRNQEPLEKKDGALNALLFAVTAWRNPPQDLQQRFAAMLQELKRQNWWADTWHRCEARVKEAALHQYGFLAQ